MTVRSGNSPGISLVETRAVYFYAEYFVNRYRSRMFCCSTGASDLKYAFQPGQKLMCQRQNLAANVLGFWSYLDLKGQLPQLCSMMRGLFPAKIELFEQFETFSYRNVIG